MVVIESFSVFQEMEEISALKRELELVRERYGKLLDAHREIQKQNCLLEERILMIVEDSSNDKENLRHAQEEIRHLKQTIKTSEHEKQRYRNDCNLAVRLLQQNPTEFHSNTPPQNMIIPTFPPTCASAYTMVNHQIPAVVDGSLSLVESLSKQSLHFVCSNCHRIIQCSDASVQTCPILTASNDHPTSILIEPHSNMTINQYHPWNSTKTFQDVGLSANPMPQMHTV